MSIGQLINILPRYYNTIKYLKLTQIYYQLYYKITGCTKKKFVHTSGISAEKLKLHYFFLTSNKCDPPKFEFLNQVVDFKSIEKIDWNYLKNGRLWCYNLNYFDFLESETHLPIVLDFVDNLDCKSVGAEPYPTSLRIINWVKFFSRLDEKISEQTIKKINNSLYNQSLLLSKKIENHILGNHLLENGFALLFAAFYFNDQRIYKKSQKILFDQLKEQILEDGAHFELSPMYHQIILERILDSYNLLYNNLKFEDQEKLFFLLQSKAELMLGWINQLTFSNSSIPLFSDSAFNIAPNTDLLNRYAKQLNLYPKTVQLRESGYRKYIDGKYEIIVDIGGIAPSYQPGHAHSDSFNFELYIDSKPVIIDTGISTYEKNVVRQIERSTLSHNTVVVNGTNQSEVWGGFRVARRANINIIKDSGSKIIANHDGYKRFNSIHERQFNFETGQIIIIDKIDDNHKINECYAAFHVHPNQSFSIKQNKIIFDFGEIIFEGNEKIDVCEFQWSSGFNQKSAAKCIKAHFSKELVTEINIK